MIASLDLSHIRGLASLYSEPLWVLLRGENPPDLVPRLRGRKLAPGLALKVAPASMRDQQRAADEGIMAVFEEAGAQILPNACGICAGYGTDRLGEDVTCISSTARNFQGRMGAASSRVWLASPLTVAAYAITGRISDPREFLVGGEGVA